MTDREKLIELIIDARRTDPETGSFTEHLADCLLANGVTVQQWIPVTERMPERNIGVLVYAPRLKNIFETFYNKNGEWEIVSYHREILNDEITHWMPLPEPPEVNYDR